MDCPACGHASPDRASFCPECGAALALRCGSCGGELTPAAKFCAECGAKTARRVPAGSTASASDRTPRDYTPKHLADKILQSKSALEGERKQVTVLSANVKGSMELAEQAGAEAGGRAAQEHSADPNPRDLPVALRDRRARRRSRRAREDRRHTRPAARELPPRVPRGVDGALARAADRAGAARTGGDPRAARRSARR